MSYNKEAQHVWAFFVYSCLTKIGQTMDFLAVSFL